MQNKNTDLFGEIVVTNDDLLHWVLAVAPRCAYNKRSFESYVKAYNVAEKVRRAKQAGTFENTISVLQLRKNWYE